MEKKEMEIVRHTTMNHLEVFIVEMTSRGPHGHDDFELGMILEGTMTLFLEQEQYHLKAGDIYFINRYQVHSFSNKTGGTASWLSRSILIFTSIFFISQNFFILKIPFFATVHFIYSSADCFSTAHAVILVKLHTMN